MSFASSLRRLWTLPRADKLLLAETAASLTRASLAIGLRPFRAVVGRASDLPREGEPDGDTCAREIKRITWAVNALGRRLPWRIVCFQKGLAVHRLLYRRRIRSTLHYGVAQNAADGVKAHVWVTHDGRPIIGGEEAVDYTCLATFPPVAAKPLVR